MYGMVANKYENITYKGLSLSAQEYITQYLTYTSTQNIKTYFLPIGLNIYKHAMYTRQGFLEEILNKTQYLSMANHMALAIKYNHRMPIIYNRGSVIYAKEDNIVN